jgi:transposase
MMPKHLRVREPTDVERTTIERMVHARTATVRDVERARIIERACAGKRVAEIAADLGCDRRTVRLWIKRFNAAGLAGLEDEPRTGHPPTYTPEQVGEVLAAALSKPADLGLPFANWTLDRLEAYLNEEKDLSIKRSRIDELLIDEGLRWRTQEGWFGDRATRAKRETPSTTDEKPIDPAFAQKRGRSRPSTQARRRRA